MSHTSKISRVPLRDIQAMQSAVQDLKEKGVNCELLRDAVPRMYYSHQHGKCDFVLRLHDAPYDVGFDRQKDGTYLPVFDNYCQHVSKQIGAACPLPNTHEGQLQHSVGQYLQSYSKHAAINAATAAGHVVESCFVDDEGNVNLNLAVL